MWTDVKSLFIVMHALSSTATKFFVNEGKLVIALHTFLSYHAFVANKFHEHAEGLHFSAFILPLHARRYAHAQRGSSCPRSVRLSVACILPNAQYRCENLWEFLWNCSVAELGSTTRKNHAHAHILRGNNYHLHQCKQLHIYCLLCDWWS